MKKTQLSLSIALAMTFAHPLLITGCSSSSSSSPETPASVQGDSSDSGSFNTLVESEILFNPTINGDTAQAKQYLNGKLSTDGALTSAQATALSTSIANAKAIDPAHPYKATAAVVDKVVTTNNYDVTVSADDIAAQKFVKKDLQLGTQKVTWEESHHDEDPRGMVVLDGRNLAVVATDEHNSLVVIDTNTAEVKSQKLFAGVVGPRYTIDSVTGASEHGLRDIAAAPDGGSVYVSVKPDKGEDSVGNDQDDRYGLFRVIIGDDGDSAAYDAAASKRFDSANVGAFGVAADGRVFVEDTDAGIIRILDADLNDSGSSLALPTDIKVADFFFTADDTLYLSTKAVKADPDATPPVAAVSAQLHKVDGAAGTVIASMDIDTAPDGLEIFDNGKQALIYEEHQYAAIVDLVSMKETRKSPLSVPLDQVIQTAVVTPDGHYAIISGHHKSEVWIFDLTLPVSRMEKLTPADTVIRALATDANGGIYAAGRDGFVNISNLVEGDVLTPQQAIDSDEAFITEASINSGQALSVVVADLGLYTQVPAGAGSDIVWSTSTSAINMTASEDSPLGAVTRPAGSDESGDITADLSYTFRDITKTASKTFPTSIRQAPGVITQQGETLDTGHRPNGFAQAVGASPDGTRAVAGFRENGGFNVIKRGAGDAPEFGLNTTVNGDIISSQAYPDGYTDERPKSVRFLDDSRVLIAMPEGENVSGALLVYGVDDDAIANGNGNAPLLNTIVVDGKIESTSHLVGGKIAVVVDKDGGRKAFIFDAEAATLGETGIALSATAGEVAISGDAQSVFVIESGGVAKYSGSSGVAEVRVTANDDFGPYILTMSEDIVYIGTDDGKLFRFNASDLSAVSEPFVTGYGGRTRVIDVVDGIAYMSIWGFGLAVVDPIEKKEIAFFDQGRIYRSGVSGDGNYVFAFVYIKRTDEGMRILKLPN